MAGLAPLAADALASRLVSGSHAPSPAQTKLAGAACDCAIAAVAAELRRRNTASVPAGRVAPLTDPVSSTGLVAEVAFGDSLRAVAAGGSCVAHAPGIAAAPGDVAHVGVNSEAHSVGVAVNDQASCHTRDVWSWPHGGCTASQAVAVQLRCMQRSREDAAEEVARVRTLERRAVRMDEEARGRAQVQRRKAELEKGFCEREQGLLMREQAAAERLRAREDDAKRRMASLRGELAQQVEDLELQRCADARRIAADQAQLQRGWNKLRQDEDAFSEAAEQALLSRRQLEEDLGRRAEREDEAVRHARLASVEAQAELKAERAELDSGRRALAQGQKQSHSTAGRLAEAEHVERRLRADLAAAREDVFSLERELAENRARLDLFAVELRRAYQDGAKEEVAAREARHEATLLRDSEVAMEGQALRQRLAFRDNEEYSRARAEAAEGQCNRLRNELAALRTQLQDAATERDRYQTSLRDRLNAAWQQERESLTSQVERLQKMCHDDARERIALQRTLQRQEKERALVEEGWWRWMQNVRERKPTSVPVALQGMFPSNAEKVSVALAPTVEAGCGLAAGESVVSAHSVGRGEMTAEYLSAVGGSWVLRDGVVSTAEEFGVVSPVVGGIVSPDAPTMENMADPGDKSGPSACRENGRTLSPEG